MKKKFNKTQFTEKHHQSMTSDWSHLPKELLQLISERLNSQLYLLRFRSVCSSWRSSIIIIPHNNNHLPFNLPRFSSIFNITSIYLLKHKLFLIKPPPPTTKTTLQLPWLIRIGPDLNQKNHLWDPLFLHQPLPFTHHVLDFNKFSILDLGYIFNIDTFRNYYGYNKVIVATCKKEQQQEREQEQQPSVIVTSNYSGELSMLHYGEDRWTTFSDMEEFSVGEICLFKGRPCTTNSTGRTVMIGPDSSIHLVANAVYGGDIKFLVESESELLLVDMYRYVGSGAHDDDDEEEEEEEEDDDDDNDDDAADDDDDDVWIDLFRLDEEEKRWVKLDNLGDRVLFLGQGCSFSISASDLGFTNGNIVICNNSDVWEKSEMSVFHVDQGRGLPLSDYSDYLKLFWPPPEWIVGPEIVKEY